MRFQSQRMSKMPIFQAKQHNGVAKARTSHAGRPSSKRARGSQQNPCLPFAPPEDWYEPVADRRSYRIIVQHPGPGYRHILTPQEVRDRLALLPPSFAQRLEVVQFSRMTMKKRSFPCYGMQWGTTLYLYPIEESLTEQFDRPPRPNLMNEVRMYGGRWEHKDPGPWYLVWSEAAIKDFYLNNILIHELGHLLDDRNASYLDRERYAEWFAVRYGYKPSRAGGRKEVKRRHHAKQRKS